VFNRLTVLDNLRIPALTEGRLKRHEVNAPPRRSSSQIKLEHHGRTNAENLSGGQKKLLELGMIMMTDPRFLPWTNPSAASTGAERALESTSGQLNREGKTIVLVSHEMPSVFKICQRLVVLDHAVSSPTFSRAVRSDERVINAYLGGIMTKLESRISTPPTSATSSS